LNETEIIPKLCKSGEGIQNFFARISFHFKRLCSQSYKNEIIFFLPHLGYLDLFVANSIAKMLSLGRKLALTKTLKGFFIEEN
jgi:hypothetical protein